MIHSFCEFCNSPAEFASVSTPKFKICKDHKQHPVNRNDFSLLPILDVNQLINEYKSQLIIRRQKIARRFIESSKKLIETIEMNLSIQLTRLDHTLLLDDKSCEHFYRKDIISNYLETLEFNLPTESDIRSIEIQISDFFSLNNSNDKRDKIQERVDKIPKRKL